MCVNQGIQKKGFQSLTGVSLKTSNEVLDKFSHYKQYNYKRRDVSIKTSNTDVTETSCQQSQAVSWYTTTKTLVPTEMCAL